MNFKKQRAIKCDSDTNHLAQIPDHQKRKITKDSMFDMVFFKWPIHYRKKKRIDSGQPENDKGTISRRKHKPDYTSPDNDSESCDISSGSGKQLPKKKHYKRKRSNIKSSLSKKHSRSHKVHVMT